MGLILDGTTGISASGNIYGGNIVVTNNFVPSSLSTAGNVQGAYILGNGSQLTGLPAGYANSDAAAYLASGTVNTNIITTANITGGNLLFGSGQVSGTGSIYATAFVGSLTGTASSAVGAATASSATTAGSATTAATVTTAAQPNITSVGTLSSLYVSGALSLGGGVVNTAGNGVSNIGATGAYFNTIFAKATSAQYADLAEMYCADAAYAPGTVVEFGGVQEVRNTTQSHSTAVAGIVSTHPSYLMNSTLVCENALEIALVGRVPCRVVGTIRKGDRLVSSDIPGVATVLDMSKYEPGCIVGKALEDYDSTNDGVIEVAVGRI